MQVVHGDEVALVDYQSWIDVHGYMVRDRKWSLERVVEGGISNNLTAIIVSVAYAYGGPSDHDIMKGLITVGAFGVSTIQIAKSRVIVQLINKHAPFMVGVNCKAR